MRLDQRVAHSAIYASVLDFVKQVPPYPPGRPIEFVAREFGLDPAGIVKLASNENPRGCSPRVVQAIAHHAGRANLYPDFHCFELQHAIARHVGISAENVLPVAGSSELISLVARAYLAPGRNALFPQCSFHSYAAAAQSVGAGHVETALRGWEPDLDGLLDAITDRTYLVYLASPNNPTGVALSIDDIERLVEVIPEHVVLVLDEAYREYLAPEERIDASHLLHKRENLLIMRTFSKIYGLAGLRVGYGLGHLALLQILRRLQLPFSVSSLAQAAATAALEDGAFAEESSAVNASERIRLAALLRERGIEYVPSTANFLLVRVGQGARCANELMRRGVIVRPLDNYGLDEWMRITVGLPAQTDRLLCVLDSVREGMRDPPGMPESRRAGDRG